MREDSPNAKAAKRKGAPVSSVSQAVLPIAVSAPESGPAAQVFFEPSPPKQQMDESPSRLRHTKYKIMQTTSLRLSHVTMDRVQLLQQALADYGPIKSLDARGLKEG